MKIKVSGENTRIFENEIAYYVIASVEDSSAEVEIVPEQGTAPDASVKPMSYGIPVIKDGQKITFTATVPAKLSVEFTKGCDKPIFLFLYAGKEEAPTGDRVITYPVGDHDIGTLELHSGETLYVPEGTVLHGVLRAKDATGITVCGRGIIDSDWEGQGRRRSIEFLRCSDLCLKDFTMTGATGWCLVPAGCNQILIDGLNILSYRMCGDGIDVVGCHDVEIRNCFFRTADDCISVKAVDYFTPDGKNDIYNVHVTHCVLWNAKPGNALEIGYEVMCDEIHDLTFEDLDIIHCEHEGWQAGATISIHCADHAVIHHIIYRDIRVEDSYDKLFDFKVMQSNYSRENERGSIRDILVERVALTAGNFPPSIISGFLPEDHLIDGVKFVDVTAYGKPMLSPLDLRMVVERAKNVSFAVTEVK